MIPSTIVKDGIDLGTIEFCYNSSKSLDNYVLFPGHSLFVSAYHPLKAIESKQVTGKAVFKLNAIGKVVEKIPSEYCREVDTNLYSAKTAHEDYELWYLRIVLT